jgi:hypothetical protein
MFKIKIMKKLPVFTAAIALSFLIYTLYKKSKHRIEDLQDVTLPEPRTHHVTDVFAKAKKVATAEEAESGKSTL